LWYCRRTSDGYCAWNCGSIRFLESDTARRLREESKSGDVTIASFVEHDRSDLRFETHLAQPDSGSLAGHHHSSTAALHPLNGK
jgi:hypothetical protein